MRSFGDYHQPLNHSFSYQTVLDCCSNNHWFNCNHRKLGHCFVACLGRRENFAIHKSCCFQGYSLNYCIVDN